MGARVREVSLKLKNLRLDAWLARPRQPRGLVLLVQAAGGSQRESRQGYVAEHLEQAGFATALLDLLTRYEDARDPDARYNVALLTRRLGQVIDLLAESPEWGHLPQAIFANGTATAAAIRSVRRRTDTVRAIVSRSGRPDLAGADPLAETHCPTLLMVGDMDLHIYNLNRQAIDLMPGQKRLVAIPGATHPFDEPGVLLHATREATDWLGRWLRGATPPGARQASAVAHAGEPSPYATAGSAPRL